MMGSCPGMVDYSLCLDRVVMLLLVCKWLISARVWLMAVTVVEVCVCVCVCFGNSEKVLAQIIINIKMKTN